VERFSIMMNFDYSKAEITVSATRLKKPPRMDEIIYELSVYSQDSSLNIDLLQEYRKVWNDIQHVKAFLFCYG
jgi:hypothetical protein